MASATREPWVLELVLGLAMWVISVVALPLVLSLGVYVYVEGAPEVKEYFQRFVGEPFRMLVASIESVLTSIFSVDLLKNFYEVFTPLCWVFWTYCVALYNFSAAFLVAAVGALFLRKVLPLKKHETWPDRWSSVVILFALGVLGLICGAANDSIFLTLAMAGSLVFLTVAANSAVGTVSSNGSRSGGGAGLGVRPLIFGLVAFGVAGVSGRGWAFVACMLAAVVEISSVTNENWLPTVTLAALGCGCLILEAASSQTYLLLMIVPLVIHYSLYILG